MIEERNDMQMDFDEDAQYTERKRILFFGLPWTFTKYIIKPSAITVDAGLFKIEENDCYICPNNKVLGYTTTTREGYRQYKSDPEDCMNCPFRNQCTKSRNHVKVINRHLWERYRERSEELRHTPKWKEIYPKRKETIERVFAECKENNGLRFTRLKGLKKIQHIAWLIFACHYLKKMAIWNGIA